MLSTSVWRGATRQRAAYVAFVVGLFLGGAGVAITLWLISGITEPIPFGVRLAVLASVGGAALLRDLHLVSFPVPQRARQIPRTVFERGLTIAAFQFGFELGTGARTHVTATAPYIVAAAIVLQFASFEAAVAAGIGFGAGRALMPSLRALSGAADRWDERLRIRIPWLVPISSAGCVVGIVGFA